MLKDFIVLILLHISCNLDSAWTNVCKIYTVIVNCSLTMITSCSKVVNLNCVVTSVECVLVLSEQLFCN